MEGIDEKLAVRYKMLDDANETINEAKARLAEMREEHREMLKSLGEDNDLKATAIQKNILWTYNKMLTNSIVPVPDAYQVTFTNTNTGEVLGFTTVNKKISVLQIPEGVYDVVATARLSLYNYLGTVKGAVINSNESLTSIPVVATKSSSLVIKEVFYSCSRTPANATYLKDNYFEIYNNGPDPVFVDGLCIGTSSNYSSASINFADAEGNLVNADFYSL